ncbi:signal peptidase I [Vulcanisaeta thermophila]|uniref:signal peptidase I n=1 Tax=Vulcanisaeta thermophila TaxID=867917 RepID=UPI0008530995|nr:signal peptidase I [Vulcanisaeta thermophila]
MPWPSALMITLVITLAVGFVIPWSVVASYSMEPTLEVGDLAIMGPPPRQCSALLNHVAIYYSPQFNDYVIHRVIEVQSTNPCTYVFKGDANPGPDPYPVPYGDVVGGVYFIIPQVGMISLSYRSFTGALFTLVLMILVLILAYALD